MKHVILMLTVLISLSACARKVEVKVAGVVQAGNYVYIKDANGRLLIIAANTKDFDQAMKTIRPGPATVDKLDLWVVTPTAPIKKTAR